MILCDQAQRLLLADLRIALMIGLVEHDLGAAEIRQAGGRAERQIFQVGMGVVDDVGAEMHGVARRLSGARGIAGQRIDHADLDVCGVRRHRGGQYGGEGVACYAGLFILPPCSRVD